MKIRNQLSLHLGLALFAAPAFAIGSSPCEKGLIIGPSQSSPVVISYRVQGDAELAEEIRRSGDWPHDGYRLAEGLWTWVYESEDSQRLEYQHRTYPQDVASRQSSQLVGDTLYRRSWGPDGVLGEYVEVLPARGLGVYQYVESFAGFPQLGLAVRGKNGFVSLDEMESDYTLVGETTEEGTTVTEYLAEWAEDGQVVTAKLYRDEVDDEVSRIHFTNAVEGAVIEHVIDIGDYMCVNGFAVPHSSSADYFVNGKKTLHYEMQVEDVWTGEEALARHPIHLPEKHRRMLVTNEQGDLIDVRPPVDSYPPPAIESGG